MFAVLTSDGCTTPTKVVPVTTLQVPSAESATEVSSSGSTVSTTSSIVADVIGQKNAYDYL